MIIEKAVREDLPAILQLQQLAFSREAEEYGDFEMKPLKQTVDDLDEEFNRSVFLKAVDDDGRIIGSTRGYIENGTSYIGMTFVHPNCQGRGIGTILIRTLEAMNPSRRYEINASTRCPQNIRLYEQLGYVKFRESFKANKAFVYLEKAD